MKNKRNILKVLTVSLAVLCACVTGANAAKKTDLVAVSADIVEISGSLTTSKGFEIGRAHV